MAADGGKTGPATAPKPRPCASRRLWRSCPSRRSGRRRPACGIGERTLRRWLTDDAAFQAEFEAARHATFQAAISRIPALTARAVDTLAALLGDKEPPAVRLGAARTVAEIGLHQYDAETILRKLDEIEARQRR